MVTRVYLFIIDTITTSSKISYTFNLSKTFEEYNLSKSLRQKKQQAVFTELILPRDCIITAREVMHATVSNNHISTL